MNPDELTPLAKRDDNPFERALLRAAQRERAPEGVDRRVLAVLGVSGAAGAGALGAVFSKYTSWFGPKSVLVTVALGASIAGVTHWVSSRDPDPPRAEPASLPAAAPIAEPLPAPEEARTETVASTRVEDLPSSQVPSPATRSPVVAKGVSSPAKGAEPGSLAREVALVEAARAELARGDARSALRSLDLHDREFPSGTLLPEARVLRIEALVRSGSELDRARANRLGDAFLAEHSTGPHARRVHAVLDRDR